MAFWALPFTGMADRRPCDNQPMIEWPRVRDQCPSAVRHRSIHATRLVCRYPSEVPRGQRPSSLPLCPLASRRPSTVLWLQGRVRMLVLKTRPRPGRVSFRAALCSFTRVHNCTVQYWRGAMRFRVVDAAFVWQAPVMSHKTIASSQNAMQRF